MKQKEILLLGATGQIGRNLVRKLLKSNYKITAVTRNIHRAGYILKTQANPGYLNLVEIKNFSEDKIESLMKSCDICINLIGILYENKKKQFNTILPPSRFTISKGNLKLKNLFIYHHGIENAKDSFYATSKIDGEKNKK